MFERLAVAFLKGKYGEAEFPFDTEDLKTFIEEHVAQPRPICGLEPVRAPASKG